MKPTHQEFPHRNFQEEVDFLSQIFPSMFLLKWRQVQLPVTAGGANSFLSASSRWRSLLYGTFELRLLVSVTLSSLVLETWCLWVKHHHLFTGKAVVKDESCGGEHNLQRSNHGDITMGFFFL